jgi:2-oxoglutarate ferredoxin oxidoreductase subunit gamma
MITATTPLSLANKRHVEIQISGFGGQGVVMAASILGRVATVEQGRNAIMVQNYGPESRGGASLAGVVIDDGEIGMPRVTDPDVIVVLSTAAYDKYGRSRPSRTALIAEEDFVTLDADAEHGRTVLAVPATRIADELGRRIVMNIVMLGYLCGATEVQPAELMKRVIASSVPSHTEELNMKAFDAGMRHAHELTAFPGAMEQPT